MNADVDAKMSEELRRSLFGHILYSVQRTVYTDIQIELRRGYHDPPDARQWCIFQPPTQVAMSTTRVTPSVWMLQTPPPPLAGGTSHQPPL